MRIWVWSNYGDPQAFCGVLVVALEQPSRKWPQHFAVSLWFFLKLSFLSSASLRFYQTTNTGHQTKLKDGDAPGPCEYIGRCAVSLSRRPVLGCRESQKDSRRAPILIYS